MLRLSNLAVSPDYTEASLAAAVAKKCGITPDQLLSCSVVRRSVDARKKDDIHFDRNADGTWPCGLREFRRK